MALVRVPLRLPQHLRERVEILRKDRGLNVVLVRAVEQWCIREEALEEGRILRLHETRSVYDEPGRVAPSTNGRIAEPETVDAPDEVPAQVMAEPQSDEPRSRRPPRSAEQWGASAERLEDLGGDGA
jgi:hypothetical protein